MKKRIFDIIQIGNKEDIPSRFFDIFIVIVISLNILSMFLQTFEQLSSMYPLFIAIEYITTFIFCIEYILRIITAEYLYPDRTKGQARLKFLWSYDGVVDLLTIIPVFFLSGFVVFRMLRVVRIFHLFRINAQYDSFNVIVSVLYEKRNQIMSSVFIILILMLASSLGMYSAEHEAQPEAFKNAFSGLWWSVSTVFTVGYGDIYPITAVGKIMAILISFLGVGAVAIPTGIISAGFVEQYQETQRNLFNKRVDVKEIMEIEVDDMLEKVKVNELEENEAVQVYLILRDNLSILPRGDISLEKGDVVVVKKSITGLKA